MCTERNPRNLGKIRRERANIVISVYEKKSTCEPLFSIAKLQNRNKRSELTLENDELLRERMPRAAV